MRTVLIFLPVILLSACNANRQGRVAVTWRADYEPRYAKGFSLYRHGDTTLLRVSNPWQFASNQEFNYILTANASPDRLDEIRTPVTRAVCMSTTHVAFISALGEAATISAVSGLKHVSDTAVRAQAAAGVTVDVGYDASVSYELIFALKPDVVFAYGVTGEFTVVEKKLNELGIKVVYIGEYLEEQPLGKAEWLLAMSAFFDRETQAVAAFDTVEARYLAAAAMVKNVAHKPLVMLNVPYKDVWYLPGTRNYTVRFIEDAGAEYIYPSHRQRETYPMSIENAFVLAQKADFWLLGNWAKSLGDLKANDPRMAEIPAFKKGKVYNSNLRMNSDGGDDFWESGIVQPDVILNDMIKIFHPELLPEHELYFYRHLE